MQARAVGLGALLLGVALLPFGAAAAEMLGCEEKMAAEMGWLDMPEGQATDPVISLLEVPMDPFAPGNDLHTCTGKIQPGAQMTSGCTMNFIFRDSTGALYLGTAGHCTSGVGATIGIMGVGPNVAQVVYDGCPPSGACPTDFTLARIYPQYYSSVDPTMCHWGGPSGVETSPGMGDTTHIYGFGTIYGGSPVTRPRTGYVLSASPNEITYLGMAQPGDSGSPIVSGDGGKGLGIHVRSSLSAPGLQIRIDPSQKYATRVDRAISQAELSTGLDIQLVNGLSAFNILGY